MQGPRGTKKKEFKQVLELANYVFRKSHGQKPEVGKFQVFVRNKK